LSQPLDDIYTEGGPAEAATRPPARWLVVLRTAIAVLMAVSSLAWAADLFRAAGFVFLTEQFLAVVYGLALGLVFLHFPLTRGTSRGPIPWYDGVLAIAGTGAAFYLGIFYSSLLDRFFELPFDALVVCWILFVLSLEGLRRTSGWPLVIIVLVFVALALLGHLLPGQMQARQVDVNRMVVYLGIDTSGLLGLTILVGVVVVMPYVLFGHLLFASGGAGFFNDIAIALMGRFRGGAAKIAISASGLFGTISGVVVSNIMATGVMTIPLMKRAGFTPRQAAAIEATASTGGQLMPPVMGAVAFIMADFLQIPYKEVAIAAAVPAILYYLAIFIQADLEAAKRNIRPIDPAEIPRVRDVMKHGWPFLLPFIVLVYSIFWRADEPEVSAIWASIATLFVGVVFGYKGQRVKARALWDGLVVTGMGALEILMISAAAGFIMGILQLSGLGFALTLALVNLGAGNVFLLLLIAGTLCIVMGMGMPTLGVYVLLAVLVAPSLVEVGISPLAAHMFILYLGMMSMITPPVAIGAFFAASIAGSEPMRTGYEAMRFAWTAFILPFLFVFSPTLLLQDPSWTNTIVSIGTAVVGVWLITAGMVGYALRPVGGAERAILLVGGAGLLLPVEMAYWTIWANIAGFILVAPVLVRQWRSIRAKAPAREQVVT
jgi:TRAP transporter 4TM/12TM fusion protein